MSKGVLLTIFGGTGDLTFRKLLPALYSMSVSGQLKGEDEILIVGRRDYTDEAYKSKAMEWVKKFSRTPFTWKDFDRFASQISYFKMDFSAPEAFLALDACFRQKRPQNHVFYFAVSPRFFSVIAEGLKRVEGAGLGKVVLEKPFGDSLADAKLLNRQLEDVFTADRIYRIDHYLGKEMVRGISAIRFTNPIFNYIWDARQIEFVELSALEEVGVETRGGYYDDAGALKDMVQNHLFQILSILAMERPNQFYGASMHAEQQKVLKALRLPDRDTLKDTVVLGQYEGYRQEPSVNPESNTETFAALSVYVDNDRWRNMPFYIRTGKKTGRREMKVTIAFRRMAPDLPRNLLTIYIQPSEGVRLQFNRKEAGESDEIVTTQMDVRQDLSASGQSNTPEAYERLLVSCIQGEQYWFSQWDQIEAGWTYVEQLKTLMQEEGLAPLLYTPGMRGPRESMDMAARRGHTFH